MKNLALLISAALVLAACSDTTGPIDSRPASGDDPSFAISDGSNDGNEHFYFLPPMVKSPSYSGTFDPTLKPEVQICVWRITDEECGPNLEMYTMDTGPGPETVRISEADELYIVNWHTEDILGAFPLGEDEVYRIRILAKGKELGFADVVVVSSGKELKNFRSGDIIPLIDGHRMPVKFRIEEGALPLAEPAVAAGSNHTCALTSAAEAFCWGRNTFGQLGTGTHGQMQMTPVPVVGGLSFASISTGAWHSCGITDEGDAFCLGANRFGELGNGTQSYSATSTPTPVVGGHKFRSISAEGYQTCGVTDDARALCWGLNDYGQLGTGTLTYVELSPTEVAGGHFFLEVKPGPVRHTCGVTTDAEVYCWGWNEYGQLGTGTTSYKEPNPLVVTGGHSFSTVAGGYWHTCGVTTSGDAYCWGWGRLGNGSYSAPATTPVAVSGAIEFSSVGAGYHYSCGLATNGNAYCWGWNQYGQFGDGTRYTEALVPRSVSGGLLFGSLSAAVNHVCGVTADSDAYCWGNNWQGQIGNGSRVSALSPSFAIDLDPATP